jgi:hypothetical protein
MAKMVNCKSCGKPVGYGALTCPNCGELHPSIRLGRAFAWLFGFCVVVAIALILLGRPSNEIAASPKSAGSPRDFVRSVLCRNTRTQKSDDQNYLEIAATLKTSIDDARRMMDQAVTDFDNGDFSCKQN